MVSFDVTRRALSLGSRDSWSGWRAKTWNETTIEMVIVLRGATQLALMAGFYPRLDAAGRTADVVAVGDQIKDANNDYWDVETVSDVYWGDSFVFRECDLTKSILYQDDFGSTTWSKTRGSDARYRTKYWMDQRLRPAQITKDNDSTTADFGVLFSNPPYPLELEFRGASNMEGLFLIEQPTSRPLMDPLTQAPYGYDESVPIHICTVNSTGCTGTALQPKMEAELRYICETYPLGSMRSPGQGIPRNRELGGMWLYNTMITLNYRRDTST